jgi:Uma2 family endonuclease
MAIPAFEEELVNQVTYPSEDGRPMAESDFQRIPLAYAVEALDVYFQNRPDVYVSGNLLIYYEEGNPKVVVAPDVFVVIGVPKRKRPSYFVWKEGKGPDFVIEITSRSTYSEDQAAKRGIYAFMGVREYFQYDPTGDYLEPRLKGLKLVGESYLPVPATTLLDGSIVLYSSVLGLELRLEGGELRFYDPVSGEKLYTYQEAEAARREEQAARLAAEARIAELEARLRALEEQTKD